MPDAFCVLLNHGNLITTNPPLMSLVGAGSRTPPDPNSTRRW
jgi:hypothetical protein